MNWLLQDCELLRDLVRILIRGAQSPGTFRGNFAVEIDVRTSMQ